MGYLHALRNKIVAMDPVAIAEKVMVASEEELIAAQREQILAGQDSEGNVIGYYKSTAYMDFKAAFNGYDLTGEVNLYLHGDFLAALTVAFVGDEIIFDSSDPKTTEIVEQYGPEIFGLNSEFKKGIMVKAVRPLFKQEIERATGLKFGNG